MSEVVLEKENITRKPGPFEKRIHEIDFIRGFLIGLVVIDHIFCSFYLVLLMRFHP